MTHFKLALSLIALLCCFSSQADEWLAHSLKTAGISHHGIGTAFAPNLFLTNQKTDELTLLLQDGTLRGRFLKKISPETIKAFQHRRQIGCEFEIGPKTEAYLYEIVGTKFKQPEHYFFVDTKIKSVSPSLKKLPSTQSHALHTEAYQLSNGMKFVHSLSYSSGETKTPTQSTVSFEDAHGKTLVKETVSLSDPNCKECTAYPWQGTPNPFTSFSVEGSPFPFIVLKETTPDSVSFGVWTFDRANKLNWVVENEYYNQCRSESKY